MLIFEIALQKVPQNNAPILQLLTKYCVLILWDCELAKKWPVKQVSDVRSGFFNNSGVTQGSISAPFLFTLISTGCMFISTALLCTCYKRLKHFCNFESGNIFFAINSHNSLTGFFYNNLLVLRSCDNVTIHTLVDTYILPCYFFFLLNRIKNRQCAQVLFGTFLFVFSDLCI